MCPTANIFWWNIFWLARARVLTAQMGQQTQYRAEAHILRVSRFHYKCLFLAVLKKVCFDDFFILSIIILILTRSSAPVWVGPCAMEQLKEKRTYHQPCKKTFSMTIQACQYFNYSVNHSFPFHYFVFQCSIPFRCFRWLNDSMLMLATVEKKKDSDFFIDIRGLWFIQNE